MNISGLTVGTYNDTLTISAAGATNTPQTAAVKLVVTPPTIDSVTISPTSVTLPAGGTQQFTDNVKGTGSFNPAVNWTTSAACGKISDSGLYTAAMNAQVCAVTVTSQADNTKSASAMVTITSLPPTISVAPGTFTFSSVQGGANPASQTLTVSNSGASGSVLTYSVSKTQPWLILGGSASGSLAASGSANVSLDVNISGLTAGTYTDTLTISAAGATNTPQIVTVTLTIAVPPDPTISMPPTATVQYGSTWQFDITANGTPACSVTSGPGSVSVSADGTVATYSVPLPGTAVAAISAWSAALICTVTNSVGKTATATATVALQYDTPVISSFSTVGIMCQAECLITVVVTGSGFYVGGTLYEDSTPMSLVSASTNVTGQPNMLPISENDRVAFIMIFDTPHYDPHRIKFSAASPNDGHGGGTSNTVYLGFYGNQNTVALSIGNQNTTAPTPAEVFQAYQAQSVIYKFLLSDGTSDGNFLQAAHGISVDDKSGNLLLTPPWGIMEIAPSGQQVGGAWINLYSIAVAAKGGYGCAAQPYDGSLTSLDLSQLPRLSPVIMAIGNEPWNVAMTKLGGEFACVAFNAGDLQLSVVKVPETQLWNFTTLVGLTPLGDLQSPPDGGWQLAVFDVSTTVKIIAVLSQHDKLVVFKQLQLDENTGLVAINDLAQTPISWVINSDQQLTGAPVLLGIPFRIAF